MWTDEYDESAADDARAEDFFNAQDKVDRLDKDAPEPPSQDVWFSYEIGSLAHRSTAEKMEFVIREAMRHSYLQPEFIIVPFNGSWVLSVQSKHPDAEADLVEYMLFAVAFDAAKRI